MQIEMTIKGLMVDPITNMPIIILRDKDGQKVLPIWVGVFEANAIALQMENVATPRPMTHDLLKNVISDLKADIQKIVVSDLKENTFYALIYLLVNGEAVAIDARPSDAIALALRASAPDLRRGPRHRPRQDGRLRARQGKRRAPAEVARRASTRTTWAATRCSRAGSPTRSLAPWRETAHFRPICIVLLTLPHAVPTMAATRARTFSCSARPR